MAKVFFWLLNSAFFHRLFRMGQSLYLNDNAFVEAILYVKKNGYFPLFLFHLWCIHAHLHGVFTLGKMLALSATVAS